ncbi:hypothetical protein [Candidatus Nitrosocosmicus franklandus]|uniref:Uncharacterized protein n=1 Tax=Candidatus Nitrosocosmicus franklandianus TaxID=1798806 RepID=A0A484I6L3_9ARCH|nr:hypothetical protein [Candidatus Nitrosocosmicus franklandus]VFJ12820.1 conserved protein of unknown function [Candidatus Nitrosocosmicus franklandus]
MTITLSSVSLTRQNESIEILRAKYFEGCIHLLRQLKRGTYYIPWDGISPTWKNERKSDTEKKLKIVVECNIEYGRYIYPRKPYVTKTIKIGGREASWIRTWLPQQLEELDRKLTKLTSSEQDAE